MMWDRIIPPWLVLLNTDAALTTALGGAHIYPASAGRVARVPSIEWLIVFDREDELFNPFLVQVDYWASGVPQAAVIEGRIRAITHRDTARTIGGFRLWTRYIDSRSHDYPAKAGVVHRSLDFRFEPLRQKYEEMHETS